MRHLRFVGLDDEARDLLEAVEDAHPSRRDGWGGRRGEQVEAPVELALGHDLRDVALVPLKGVRDLREATAVLGEVRAEILERLLVRVHARLLRVRDEDDPIGAREDELARRAEINLPRHGEELEADVQISDARDTHRQEIEIERALRRRREGDQLAPMLRLGPFMDRLKSRRFAAQTRAVEDDLEDELARERVERRHREGQHTPNSVDANSEARRGNEMAGLC